MMINMHLNDKNMILGFNIVKYVFFYKNDYLELKLINMMINMHLMINI